MTASQVGNDTFAPARDVKKSIKIIKTAQTICYEILREIVREHRQFNPKEFRIVAAPDVIDLFLEEQSTFLAELSEFIGKPILLRAEALFAQEHYDIVLL